MKPFFFLLFFLFASLIFAADFPFQTPFSVDETGTIRDASGAKVKLWGVNYLVPFNHNFVNIKQSGIPHTACIDRDMAHFRLMGVDFIRVHLYDREITDARGHLLSNEHLRIFDYLVESAARNGIFLMLTPTVWWNTVENEVRMQEGYAYWDLTQQSNFGFSNYFAKDALLWHPAAIECQKRYLRELFSHPNAFSGKRLCEYSNIVAIELTNEPQYISPGRLKAQPKMGAELFSDEPVPNYLKEYENLELAQARARILTRYFKELWPVVDEFFPKTVLKTHISYDLNSPEMEQAFRDGGIQAVNWVAYWNPVGQFDGGNTDWANFLDQAKSWLGSHKSQHQPAGMGKIIYEYGASSSLDGYVLGAFATDFNRADVQMAAFFTYTPSAVAEYSPGWLIHYLSMEHTPNKAAAFAAAGEIFRSEIPVGELKWEPEAWFGPNFSITRKDKNVDFLNAEQGVFRYAASTNREIPAEELASLTTISGRGASCAASSSGSGAYFLTKNTDQNPEAQTRNWTLNLFPNQNYVNDPSGAKTFRHMANRYMNINNMPVVSRLSEVPVEFELKPGVGRIVAIEPVFNSTPAPQKVRDGVWRVYPGEYRLSVKKP